MIQDIKSSEKTLCKINLWAVVLFLISLLIGFRGLYLPDTDYFNYKELFSLSPKISVVVKGDKELVSPVDWLFYGGMSLFKEIGLSFNFFLFIVSFISLFSKWVVIKSELRFNRSAISVALLWLALNGWLYEYMQIRWSLSLSFLALLIIQDSTFKKLIFFLSSFSIHAGSIILLPVFLFSFVKKNSTLALLLPIIFLSVLFSENVFNLVVDIVASSLSSEYLTSKIVNYSSTDFGGLSTLSIFRFSMLIILLVFFLFKWEAKEFNIFFGGVFLLSTLFSFNTFFSRVTPFVELIALISIFKYTERKSLKYRHFVFMMSVILALILIFLLGRVSYLNGSLHFIN
ncbi:MULTISPECIES: EpsG family protein [Idiomarina]|uniref:EpsG family protein n=1 Tax=Idiomarina TaxID=135575 RepID=UPI000C0A7019|nr:MULTISPECIES: EpsG family protein [Idiomarina]MAC34676.1 hypothetical protein [Haliea sp.]MAO68555.1 hypothetical protein [Idiomarina sp.]MBF81296.1 hypothetical protein [Idiomarina sp.]